MSRVAKQPIILPAGVAVQIQGRCITVSGPSGILKQEIHPAVDFIQEGNSLLCRACESLASQDSAQMGTARAIVNNMVLGVMRPFEKKLLLVGVGYKAQKQGSQVILNVGRSHPVCYQVESGIDVSCPTPTEILVKGIDKQRVGQVAADLRAIRPPEPYKGKGLRYAQEAIRMKEAKKK